MKEPSLVTSQNPLAFYDPDGLCWKMSQATLLSEEPALLEVLPQWGTTAGGVLYEHQTPVRLTAVRDGSVSLPTPLAGGDWGAGKTVEEYDEWAARQKTADGRPAPHGKSLSVEMKRPPTPRAGFVPSQKLTIREENHHHLEEVIARTVLMPTPAARDWKDTGKNTDYEKLASKSKLTGVIMTLPLNDGKKPSDEPPQPPPTTKD
jgi:hypothetical protein